MTRPMSWYSGSHDTVTSRSLICIRAANPTQFAMALPCVITASLLVPVVPLVLCRWSAMSRREPFDRQPRGGLGCFEPAEIEFDDRRGGVKVVDERVAGFHHQMAVGTECSHRRFDRGDDVCPLVERSADRMDHGQPAGEHGAEVGGDDRFGLGDGDQHRFVGADSAVDQTAGEVERPPHERRVVQVVDAIVAPAVEAETGACVRRRRDVSNRLTRSSQPDRG